MAGSPYRCSGSREHRRQNELHSRGSKEKNKNPRHSPEAVILILVISCYMLQPSCRDHQKPLTLHVLLLAGGAGLRAVEKRQEGRPKK
jgi:hypothetical protein